MKKAILKVTGLAAMAALMMYNVQVFDTENSSNISLAALGNMAMADEYENGGGASGVFGTAVLHTICHTITIGGGPIPGSYSYQDCHDEWQCDGWSGGCY